MVGRLILLAILFYVLYYFARDICEEIYESGEDLMKYRIDIYKGTTHIKQITTNSATTVLSTIQQYRNNTIRWEYVYGIKFYRIYIRE